MSVVHEIELDIDKVRMRTDQPVHVRCGDKGSQTVKCYLMKNGEPYTVPSGTTAKLEILKRDGTWTVTNASASGTIVSGVVPPAAMTAPGECRRAYFRLVSSNGSMEDTTEDFYLYVFPNATQDAIESRPYTDQLDELIAAASQELQDTIDEVRDMRTGYDGFEHESAGDAIRAASSSIAENDIPSFNWTHSIINMNNGSITDNVPRRLGFKEPCTAPCDMVITPDEGYVVSFAVLDSTSSTHTADDFVRRSNSENWYGARRGVFIAKGERFFINVKRDDNAEMSIGEGVHVRAKKLDDLARNNSVKVVVGGHNLATGMPSYSKYRMSMLLPVGSGSVVKIPYKETGGDTVYSCDAILAFYKDGEYLGTLYSNDSQAGSSTTQTSVVIGSSSLPYLKYLGSVDIDAEALGKCPDADQVLVNVGFANYRPGDAMIPYYGFIDSLGDDFCVYSSKCYALIDHDGSRTSRPPMRRVSSEEIGVAPITLSALGGYTDNDNMAYMGIRELRNDILFMRCWGISMILQLYKGGKYIGKIDPNGDVNKTGGSWKRFYGDINVGSIAKKHGADSFRIGFITGFTPGQDMVQHINEFMDEHVDFYVAPVGLEQDRFDSANYVVLQDGLRHFVGYDEVTVVDGVQKYLSGVQSFCKYEGKYYSTDGSTLWVQDEEFAVESETAIDLGHGNALQLGTSHFAYASGWDDNKVHVLDLDTLEKVREIALPFSGTHYTTCAVDDLNEVMYIFDRRTYPVTIENYKFIVYDYANEEILSTRKVRGFGAMQSCDYLEGKIAVIYGFNSDTPPGGFVMNTCGDVIADYVFEFIKNVEPEGIFLDRGNGFNRESKHDLLVSTARKKIYAISAI